MPPSSGSDLMAEEISGTFLSNVGSCLATTGRRSSEVRNSNVSSAFYRMGHEKVVRLPFCTCPCDILSGVSMYIA